MNKVKIIKHASALILGLGGLVIIWLGEGGYDALGVFLTLWGNNIGNKL